MENAMDTSSIDVLSDDECYQALRFLVKHAYGNNTDITVNDARDIAITHAWGITSLYVFGYKLNDKFAIIDFKIKDSWKQVLKDMINWCHNGQYVSCVRGDSIIIDERTSIEEVIINVNLDLRLE